MKPPEVLSQILELLILEQRLLGEGGGIFQNVDIESVIMYLFFGHGDEGIHECLRFL